MRKLANIKQLGQVIYKTRKKQGLTQAQLAMVAGIGVRFIRELEHGKESCHIGKVLHVINILGISIMIEEYNDS